MENKVFEKINSELEKIDKNENQIFFFVIDTKGNPSGSLEYIYKLAYILHEHEYNVTMLYQTIGEEDDFVGVREWLGDKYADLAHKSVSNEDINVSPSDILFIPEIFANVMVQTKKLPCKRIAILQNYDYMVEQMPFSVQWGDLGIIDCLTNTKVNAEKIKNVFPYVKTHIIPPYIDEVFGTTNEPKKMIINVIVKDQGDINRIIKPFYWKYPTYKWVSFREIRGLNKTELAAAFRESEVTIIVDDNTSFGYTALESAKSGNIVLMKTPITEVEWSKNEDDTYNDACIWFNTFDECHKMLVNIIRSIVTEKIPAKLQEDTANVIAKYTKDNTENSILQYVSNTINKRRDEIAALLDENKETKSEKK